jgi:hypothetical protein
MKNTLMLLLGLWLTACTSSQVIRDSEYKFSEAAFKSGAPEKALEEFPKKEQGGFVTSIEKSWLGLWADKNDQEDLLKQARTLDERKYTSLSRETGYFFFNESEEGYIPAEHEVIVMHLISAMYFMRAQDWDKARVETKKASYFVETIFSAKQKHFDDPAIRLWLASLWAVLGEWNESQVDLRRAYEMTKDKNIQALIDLKSAPKDLSIIFQGSGPFVTWTFGNPLPGFNQNPDKITYKINYPTLPWYERHQERNTIIRDKIANSNYMSQYYGVLLSKGSEKTLGFVAANTVRLAGLAIGTAIVGGGIYLLAVTGAGSASSSSDLVGSIIGVGIAAGGTVWEQGSKLAESSDISVKANEARNKEDLKTYRFVRFLPSWISLEDKSVVNASGSNFVLQSPKSPTKVLFIQKF